VSLLFPTLSLTGKPVAAKNKLLGSNSRAKKKLNKIRYCKNATVGTFDRMQETCRGANSPIFLGFLQKSKF
jgi:hypothetical protein